MRDDRRRRPRWLAAAGLASVLIASGCAPKIVPLPTPGAPQYPDYLFPQVPAALSSSAASGHHDRGWRFLQAGDLQNAEKEFEAALKESPSFYPAETGLGDVALASRNPAGATGWFGQALQQDARYVPALVGRAQAQVALKHDDEALKSFQAALAVDPSLADVRRQIAVLQFRDQQQTIDSARRAAAAGRDDEAEKDYEQAIAASPDSAFLYRELGDVELKHGEAAQALDHFRKAVALDPGDAHAWAQIGVVLEQQHDLDGAVSALQQAYAADPGPALERQLQDARSRAAAAKLPAAYRAIDQEARITRADLAALIGVRLASLLRAAPPSGSVLITDARGSWASVWIMEVTRAGVMEPYPNHTFQPQAVVSRGDLATVLSRVLNLMTSQAPSLARQWAGRRQSIRDVPPQHLSYPAVSLVVAAGVMPLQADGTFQLARPVSGAEAIAAIAKVQALEVPGDAPQGGRTR
jgi:tetratricopeptide (TPR) repeat protein